jgi:hypothetical protein
LSIVVRRHFHAMMQLILWYRTWVCIETTQLAATMDWTSGQLLIELEMQIIGLDGHPFGCL